MQPQEYDYIFPLGEKCFTTQTLYKLNLRKTSGPFDWTDCYGAGSGLGMRLKLILDEFHNFIDSDLLTPVYQNDIRIFVNTATQMAFRHEFAPDDDFDSKYPEIKEKYDRRISRFCNILRSGKRILFVYAASLFENSDVSDTIEKLSQIHKKFNNPNIDILVVDSDSKLNRRNKIKFKQINPHVIWVSGCDLYKPTSVSTSEYYVGVMTKILSCVVKEYQPRLIVSLTSFPARINTVHQTIISLLNQTKSADMVILWLAPEQFPGGESELPPQLLALKSRGLTIDWYHDIKSYKKLIPALRKYPNDLIVTVDDDLIFKPTMLEKLYNSYLKHPHDINTHHTTQFVYRRDCFDTIAGGHVYYRGTHILNKLTGGAGTLYPPKCFHRDVLNEDLIMKLAPTNDDQWFWLMAALNGVYVRVVPECQVQLNYIEGSQDVGLYLINDRGDNLFWRDFAAIMGHYPHLYRMLVRAGIKTHLFYKQRTKTRRRIYFMGHKILSYKKRVRHRRLRDMPESKLPRYLSHVFRARTGKEPSDKLTTLSEKIIWSGMFDVSAQKIQCTDKLLVRDYVSATVGNKYLPELYAVYKRPHQFKLHRLPKRFVLTYNAGAGNKHTILVQDKSDINVRDIRAQMREWLRYDHSEQACEMQYRYIKPRVIAREFLDIRTDVEYKLWCFNGRVEFICQNVYPDAHRQIGFATYDRNWNKLDFYQVLPNSYHVPDTLPKPAFLDEMISVAEKLASPFNFVRVDFYETLDGKLMFGELTFSPTAGNLKYAPDDAAVQNKYGALLNIPNRDI